MDALKRTLIEKAGHDFGFEYTVGESTTSLTLGSAIHPLHAEVMCANADYLVRLTNANPLLISELQRDFPVFNNEITCGTIEVLAIVLKRSSALARSLPNQAEQDFDAAVDIELKALPGRFKGTEVERMVRQRVGQDTYRRAMVEYWGGACAVTDVAIPEILRASHALPWAECKTDAQRLDVFNGFLLTANLDALFDRFLISFDKAGVILISDLISENDREFLGLNDNLQLRWLTEQHENYLELHRVRLQVKQVQADE